MSKNYCHGIAIKIVLFFLELYAKFVQEKYKYSYLVFISRVTGLDGIGFQDKDVSELKYQSIV